MIVLFLLKILPVDYLGGIVVMLFISGLLYAWLNAWRQTEKLVKADSAEQPTLEEEETEMEVEYPTNLAHSAEHEMREKKEKEIALAGT